MSTTIEVLTLERPLGGLAPAPVWPAGVALVPLRTRDAQSIHALISRAYANGYGTVQPDWLDWWEWLRSDREFDQKLCLLAAKGNAIIGLCLIWTSAFVKDLVVDPDHHRSGIGKALLTAAIAEMTARHHTALRLKVDARNAPARRLYESLGFRPAI